MFLRNRIIVCLKLLVLLHLCIDHVLQCRKNVPAVIVSLPISTLTSGSTPDAITPATTHRYVHEEDTRCGIPFESPALTHLLLPLVCALHGFLPASASLLLAAAQTPTTQTVANAALTTALQKQTAVATDGVSVSSVLTSSSSINGCNATSPSSSKAINISSISGVRECGNCHRREQPTTISPSGITISPVIRFQLCGQCHNTAYCSRECARAAWRTHKLTCVAV